MIYFVPLVSLCLVQLVESWFLALFDHQYHHQTRLECIELDPRLLMLTEQGGEERDGYE